MIYHHILPVFQFLLSVLVVLAAMTIGYKIEKFFDKIFGKDSWTSRILCIPNTLVIFVPMALIINAIYNI